MADEGPLDSRAAGSSKRKRAEGEHPPSTAHRQGKGKGKAAGPSSSSSSFRRKQDAGQPSTDQNKGQKQGRPAHFKPPTTPYLSVNALKSSLRQTRRLLAKPRLAEDVKLEAERRLKSIEADLDKAQHVQTERKNAGRYHKVRFLERRKLEKILRRRKREVEKGQLSAEEVKQVEKDIGQHRVLLNYVLHFPTSLKYVSLLQTSPSSPSNSQEGGATQSKTYKAALAYKAEVERKMLAGQMSAEPEVELVERYKEQKRAEKLKKKGGDAGVSSKENGSGGKADGKGKKARKAEEEDSDDEAEERENDLKQGDDIDAASTSEDDISSVVSDDSESESEDEEEVEDKPIAKKQKLHQNQAPAGAKSNGKKAGGRAKAVTSESLPKKVSEKIKQDDFFDL